MLLHQKWKYKTGGGFLTPFRQHKQCIAAMKRITLLGSFLFLSNFQSRSAKLRVKWRSVEAKGCIERIHLRIQYPLASHVWQTFVQTKTLHLVVKQPLTIYIQWYTREKLTIFIGLPLTYVCVGVTIASVVASGDSVEACDCFVGRIIILWMTRGE